MATPFSQLTKHWYLPLILGILYILLSIWILSSPLETFLGLTILFSVSFFVSGILEIVFAVSNRQLLSGWGWRLMGGIIDLIFGMILMCSPATGAIALTVLVPFWVIFRSFLAIGTSIDLSKIPHSGWGFQLFLGILGIISGIILLVNPVLSGLFLVYTVGFGIFILGIYQIVFSIKLKGLKKD